MEEYIGDPDKALGFLRLRRGLVAPIGSQAYGDFESTARKRRGDRHGHCHGRHETRERRSDIVLPMAEIRRWLSGRTKPREAGTNGRYARAIAGLGGYAVSTVWEMPKDSDIPAGVRLTLVQNRFLHSEIGRSALL